MTPLEEQVLIICHVVHLPGDERREGGAGLLQADRIEPAQPEAPHHHQRFWQAPHGDENGVDGDENGVDGDDDGEDENGS